ncbi:MAG: hypothetical protein F4X26_07930 [Chloroflexi bacterium]|nr:hypothetical protein [Chloroflexota bacterium]
MGHPGDKWDALIERVQSDALLWFSDIQEEWLDLLWTLDAYRRESTPPARMGNPKARPRPRLAGIYRGKGNWFAQIVALLLENQTTQVIAPRNRIQGFSQTHQIDVAWPDRKVDPLICVETKVTGGPPYGSHNARGALNDWSNRRKELKFAATDLKLYRRGMETRIDHWDQWRTNESPSVYLLWAARLGPSETVEDIVQEAQSLTNSYLDGAGVLCWQEAVDGTSYELVNLPNQARVHELDDVLYRIATAIQQGTT